MQNGQYDIRGQEGHGNRYVAVDSDRPVLDHVEDLGVVPLGADHQPRYVLAQHDLSFISVLIHHLRNFHLSM